MLFLRTRRIWQAMWVQRIDEAIFLQPSSVRKSGSRASGPRPGVPDWIVELGIGVGSRPIEVHVGGC
ncbi:hypothetical protein ACFRCW_37070 [Streptomyces sp. NPDC056653]|uniref:hypothetical protein n=1 Tax=Streptomyces sp. NPDC056653 TaxID=3345894 RepID=UPI0036C25E06